MSDDLIRERWARYVAGETLSADDRRELLEALWTHPALRDELLRDLQMHGLIRAAGTVEKDADAFARSVAEFMANERDGSRFVRMVDTRIKQQPQTRRRQLRRGDSSPISPWLFGLAAAGMFAAILFAIGSGSAPAGDGAAERRHRLAQERAAAEARRRAAEARKATIERKQELLAVPAATPAVDRKVEEDRKLERARLEKEREQVERELQEAIARARKVDEELASVPEPPAPPAPTPPEPKPETKATRAEVARIGKVEGDVTLEGAPAAAAVAIGAGERLELGGNGSAEIVFADQTRVEAGPGTSLGGFQLQDGKRLRLSKGSLVADVKKQPRGQPMVIETPHGAATVLGTMLRLVVEPGEKGVTRLEVTEGKVQLRNLAGRSVEVVSGHYAVTASGGEIVSKVLVPETLALLMLNAKGSVGFNFGPPDVAPPDGYLTDSGQSFDAKRGYGWKEQIVQVHDEMDGNRPQLTRMTARTAKVIKDPLKEGLLAVGWKDIVQTWTMTIPNGRYQVTICAGQAGWPQGPHHVWIEGQQVIDNAVTKAGEFIERTVRVDVKDLELTMRVGGGGKDLDGTSDTILCYMVVRKVEK